jgi:pyridoxamine 5'-phosphate oxidase
MANKDYTGPRLDPADVGDDPIAEVRRWFGEASPSEPQANAVTLATVGADGRPSARVVLVQEIDARGFAFYTNYESRKGRELDARPDAALVYFWPSVHRQVRVEGRVERLTPEESDRYFAKRPRGSQIGAVASPQSEVIADREGLERAVAELDARYAGAAPPRPAHWGGYRLVPDVVELWQGQTSRLHDRVRYRLDGGRWIKERLAP